MPGTFIPNSDYLIDVALGKVEGASIVHKFGQTDSVGTSFVPIARGGIYRMPQVGSATTLRIKAGNVNDDAAGTGARKVIIQGTLASGLEGTVELTTAGTSASSASAESFIRYYRGWVSESGTYADLSNGSHDADIVIENGAGGTDWGTIALNNYPRSQSEIGFFTIPTDCTGYFLTAFGFSDKTKITELLFLKRTGIIKTVAPYDAMRVVFEERVEGGEFTVEPKAPILLGSGCDVGFMAKIDAGTSEVEIDFEILLIKN